MIYKIPVSWEVFDVVQIEAETIEEAIDIFDKTLDDIELPRNPGYIDGSFKRDDEEYVKYENGIND